MLTVYGSHHDAHRRHFRKSCAKWTRKRHWSSGWGLPQELMATERVIDPLWNRVVVIWGTIFPSGQKWGYTTQNLCKIPSFIICWATKSTNPNRNSQHRRKALGVGCFATAHWFIGHRFAQRLNGFSKKKLKCESHGQRNIPKPVDVEQITSGCVQKRMLRWVFISSWTRPWFWTYPKLCTPEGFSLHDKCN